MREQASNLRRAERAEKAKAKKAPKRQIGKTVANAYAKEADEALNAINGFVANRAEAAANPPGRGEIVGGELAKQADTLAALARKKGGTDAVQAQLAAMLRIMRYEVQKAADDRHMKTVKDIHEATTDKIVCSAIAAFQMQMKEQGGLPPAVTIPSYTLCRMLDALNRAGYSAEGRKEVGR